MEFNELMNIIRKHPNISNLVMIQEAEQLPDGKLESIHKWEIRFDFDDSV